MKNGINSEEGFNPGRIRAKTTWGIVGAGLIALSVGVAVFFSVLIVLFPLTSKLPGRVDAGAAAGLIDWGLLDGIAGLATFSLVVGGLIFAFIDHIQNAVQRKREQAEASFNIYRELNDRLMNHEAIAARRWIIFNLPTLEEMGDDKQKWLDHVNRQLDKVPRGWRGDRPPGRQYLKQALDTLDFIGFVAGHYWNMENELVMWMSPSIAKVWDRVEYYVEQEALRRAEPDYYESAREFGKYCVEWRQNNNYPKSRIIKNAT